MLCALVIAMHDLLEYRYMDVVTGNLLCFVQIACGSKNDCEITSEEASESPEENYQELFTKTKKWRIGDNKSSA